MYFDPFNLYLYFVVGLLGLVMGSFLNCYASRIISGESILRGRSHCTSCGHELGALDLVPVFSWIFLKGKCRYCGADVSIRYPLTEFLCFIGYVFIAVKYGFSIKTVEYIFLFSILFVCSLVDIDDGWIPDRFIIAGIVGFFVFNFNDKGTVKNGILGGLIIFGVLYLLVFMFNKIKGIDSMGGGDLKLFFMLGLYFGIMKVVLMAFIACIVGIIFAYARGNKAEEAFPFGPSIAIAAFITMLTGEEILMWYLSLFI
ncbi:MAG: prepilin peptidase [Erysipelotrichaceae bacterium]|nr:prepilin peptidase [Erysipelotrichaceae bacterium]